MNALNDIDGIFFGGEIQSINRLNKKGGETVHHSPLEVILIMQD